MFLSVLSQVSLAQSEDHIWILGASIVNGTDTNGLHWGNTVIDFNGNIPLMYYDSTITLDMYGSNASISSPDGNLRIYGNGMLLNGADHKGIPGADTTAYGDYWENWNLKNVQALNGGDWQGGFPIIQGLLILPSPGEENEYTIVYKLIKFNSELYAESILSTQVKYDNVGQQYHGFNNDKVLYNDERLNIGKINACRHANGRDWWIIQQSEFNKELLIFLLDNKGYELITRRSTSEIDESNITSEQAYFSADGSKYMVIDSYGAEERFLYLTIYNFDRAVGQLDILFKDTLPQYRIYGNGSFSPSSELLYVTNHKELYQYDLTSNNIKESRILIDTFDGYRFKYNEFDPGTPTEIGPMALGPDKRIYAVPESSNRFMHVIHYPDRIGKDCNFEQRAIMLPTSNPIGIPNFPHYRLGPIDGSIADSLGIDNDPVAKFRYVQDTLDYLTIEFTDLSYYEPTSWVWDFGDGTIVEGSAPDQHSYSENGVYNVCLSVSNENGSNQFCRTLYLGVTSNNGVNIDLDITMMPNPCTDYIQIRLSDYIPVKGTYQIYNTNGSLINDGSVFQGLNYIDTHLHPSGMYFLKVLDEGKEIFVEPYLKVD